MAAAVPPMDGSRILFDSPMPNEATTAPRSLPTPPSPTTMKASPMYVFPTSGSTIPVRASRPTPHAAQKPARGVHARLVAEVEPGGLLEDHPDPPRDDERLQGPAVEEADDPALEGEPHQPGHEERERQRHEEEIVLMGGVARGEDLLHHVRRVGSEHEHLAVGHVDDAHQAEGHGEPEAHDQQDGPEADAVEEIAGQVAPGEEHF